jgi:hypothetical protein
MLTLSEIIGKKVRINWNNEIRKDFHIPYECTGTVYLVKDKEYSYEVIEKNKKVFTFSYNDYRRGIIKTELI